MARLTLDRFMDMVDWSLFELPSDRGQYIRGKKNFATVCPLQERFGLTDYSATAKYRGMLSKDVRNIMTAADSGARKTYPLRKRMLYRIKKAKGLI